MTTVVFLGPSLPVEEARTILDAVFLPPAGKGDLLTALVEYRPDVIALIDGVFLQTLAVWHKEILYALERGVAVYGSSSMGALRAAETEAFGMRGVGEVYRMYANGELTDDDEVALAHGPAPYGYRKLSEPMVNIRATLAAAVRDGAVSAEVAAEVAAAAKSLYFPQRTFPSIFAEAAGRGLPDGALEALRRYIGHHYVDIKRDDAVELLTMLGRLPESRPLGSPPGFTFQRTSHFDTLYNRDRPVMRGGTAVPLESIANHAALHDDRFDDLNFRALNRALVGVLGDVLDIDADPGDAQEELQRFRRRRGLLTDEALRGWLVRNNVEAAELDELMAQLALCRRLQRWFVMANWMERSTRLVLDELRLDGRYEQWADRAAAQQRLLEHAGEPDLRAAARTPVAALLDEHRAWTGRCVDTDPASWAEEAGFHSVDHLRMELGRAGAAREAVMRLLADEGSGAPRQAGQGG